jgi:hypothetical protein
MFTEVKTDHVDDNGVVHIDGYKTFDEDETGTGIGYFIHGEVYWRDAEYQFDPLVKAIVQELKDEQEPFVLDKIDYTMLKEQKTVLVTLSEQFDTDSMNGGALDGVISLIDSIQDYAVDTLGKAEGEVFNLESE